MTEEEHTRRVFESHVGSTAGAPSPGQPLSSGASQREDRTVHAVTYKGIEIVRYERAGKWYLEWPSGSMIPCKHVGVGDAARTAVEHGQTINFGLPGGKTFDARVRRLRGF